MAYQEGEHSRLRRQSSKRAITLALEGQWREAIAVNQEIIELFPNDVDAYNRLGRAHMELGEYSRAEEAYRRAAEIDPYNSIARKNLQRLSHLAQTAVSSEVTAHKLEPQQFIEEVGKAGIVRLRNLAAPQVLARTTAGESLSLKVDGPNLVVENKRGEYLGQVEPVLGQRLIRLMVGGNKYTASIISSSEKAVTVIIREVYQHPNQTGRISFPLKVADGTRSDVGDMVIRREIEAEEALVGEPGYTVVGGEETELPPEESADNDGEIEEE